MSGDLNALADRVEQASEPSCGLFREAFNAVFPKSARIWKDEDREEWTAEYSDHHERSWAFAELLEAKAYLDAAISLLGPKWSIALTTPGGFRGGIVVRLKTVERNPFGEGEAIRGTGATPALALRAAALRARATQGDAA